MEGYFILLIFHDLLVFLVLLFGIITKNTNLWDKNSIMIKKIPIFRGIFFLSNFFCGIFPENVVLFGIFGIFEVPRIRGVIESIPWGIEE
jgi:hypothetical protein